MIVAAVEPHGAAVQQVIGEQQLDLHVILNKGAVMVLPRGVNKAFGVQAAAAALGIAPRSIVAVGDAENDADFLAACGYGVAVANALPSLKQQANMVTAAARGAGVVEVIEWMLGEGTEDD